MIELPSGLAAELVPMSWLLGVWEGTGLVEYEVLCRRHYMRRMNSQSARAAARDADILPFDLDICPVPPTA